MAVSSEKYFPFDSDEVDGKFTREYLAEDFARYFRAFISSGTFMAVSDNLQVIANGDMTVTLKPGSLIIEGYRYDNVADIIIPITPADGVLSRIDRISITWSKSDNDIHYTLQEGYFSYNPAPPVCRRTEDYKDYVVADIMVQAGAISIRQNDITDQRTNNAVCGLAVPFGNLNTSAVHWDPLTNEEIDEIFAKAGASGDSGGSVPSSYTPISNTELDAMFGEEEE